MKPPLKENSPGTAKTGGATPVRPRDAATLVVLDPEDGDPGRTRVLMGRRAPRHDFLPDVFVFPGGRVDQADSAAPAGRGLDRAVVLKTGETTQQAHALATAAIRETFEETGLALLDQVDSATPHPLPDRPEPGARHSGEWPGPGFTPRYYVLDFIGRAITPPPSPKRFDTRFFAAHAIHAHGDLLGNGELLDLDWYPLDAAVKLPLIDVTEFILGHVSDLLKTGEPVGPGLCPEPPFYTWDDDDWSVD